MPPLFTDHIALLPNKSVRSLMLKDTFASQDAYLVSKDTLRQKTLSCVSTTPYVKRRFNKTNSLCPRHLASTICIQQWGRTLLGWNLLIFVSRPTFVLWMCLLIDFNPSNTSMVSAQTSFPRWNCDDLHPIAKESLLKFRGNHIRESTNLDVPRLTGI